MLALTGFHQFFFHFAHIDLLIASFGASAVILYGVPDSPLGTPRAFVGGMVISAVVGCAIRNAIKDHPWLAIPLAVALSIILMEVTRTVHPPGGAVAFIAAMQRPERPVAEFQIVVAVFLDCLAMLVVAFIVMNLNPRTPGYPKYWLGSRGWKPWQW
ncbi:hypothetical protein WJX74_008463 [Apatococcus lobatus]|uniref:HPP transmembrane region domain-containing protein n=1 Tax=Apatococcus lobatus TaxID=904363 RepID=A0AAW1QZK2_9CHLO